MTLKQDIEGTSSAILVAEVLTFFALWLFGSYLYILDIEFSRVLICLVLISFIVLFIITTMSLAELISRARKTMSKENNQKGWILIDSLIGVLILSVALSALAVAYRQSTITTASARDYNQAVFIAQQTLENLKLNDGQSSFVGLPQNLSPETKNNITYNIKIERATNVSESLDSKIIPIRTTVSWININQPKKLEMVSYYYTN